MEPKQLTWTPAGMFKVSAQIPPGPEPEHTAPCWVSSAGQIWAEELRSPPASRNQEEALRVWLMCHGYGVMVLNPVPSEHVLISIHPMLSYQQVPPQEQKDPSWIVRSKSEDHR